MTISQRSLMKNCWTSYSQLIRSHFWARMISRAFSYAEPAPDFVRFRVLS